MSHATQTVTPQLEAYLVTADAALNGGSAPTTAPAERTEVGPLLKKGEPITAASLQASLQALEAQVQSAQSAGEQIDANRVTAWFQNARDRLGEIDPATSISPAEFEAAGAARPNDATDEQIARYQLAGKVRSIAISLNNVRAALNTALQARRKAETDARELEENEREMKALIDAQRALSAQKKTQSTPSQSSATSTQNDDDGEDEDEDEDEDSDDDKDPNFPHKGKHRAPKKRKGVAITSNKQIMQLTSGRGKKALYFSRDSQVVLQLEGQARQNGLAVMSESTIVHKFANEIGADQGESTSCIRIDGDHGHPIVQSGKNNASFESYIERDVAYWVERYKKEPDPALAGLKAIDTYLKTIGNRVSQYLPKTLPPGLKQAVGKF